MDKMVRVFLYLSAFLLLASSCSSDGNKSSQTAETEYEYTRTIPPADFLKAYHAQPGAVMIDVRTPKEYVDGKIVPEAVNVDYHGDDFLEKILMHDKNDPIYIYCFSGGRSSKAAYKMRQLGFDRIYECQGGYQRWEKENKK